MNWYCKKQLLDEVFVISRIVKVEVSVISRSQRLVGSSRRSVSWGAARKTAREKNKEAAARGSERTPVGKLNKRSSVRATTRTGYM